MAKTAKSVAVFDGYADMIVGWTSQALRSLDNELRSISARRLFWSIVLVDIVLALSLIATVAIPRRARLTVTARTQILTISVAKNAGFDSWGLVEPVSATTLGGPICDKPALDMPTRLGGPFSIVAKTSADGGLVVVFSDVAPSALGILTCDRKPRDYGTYLVLTWSREAATSIGLSFAGRLAVGSQTANLSNPRLLLDGKIIAQSSSAPFRDSVVSSETTLFTGDYVVLPGKATGDYAVAHGILRIKDGEIDVTAHAVAPEAAVTHIGQQDTSISESIAPSFLAKLQAQSQWGLLLLVIAILLHMFAALRDYRAEAAGPTKPTQPSSKA